MTTTPKLSTLLTEALEELQRCYASPDCKIDMSIYLCQEGSVCTVCLAGAWAVRYFRENDINPGLVYCTSDPSWLAMKVGEPRLGKWMHAINSARLGLVESALIELYGYDSTERMCWAAWYRPDINITKYHVSQKQFIRDIKSLIEQLTALDL